MPQKRIQDPDIIDLALIEQALNENFEVIVQFSDNTYTDKILRELNELCLGYNENFTIRFYGHHRSIFDCKTLRKITNVKSLGVDCLIKAQNIDSLTKLDQLKKLRLGIYELKDTEILSAENFKKLNRLVIGDTKTRALNLEYLKHYHDLTYLMICGHTKNIDVVGELKRLDFLSLNSISKVSLNFVNRLPALKILRIILGGRPNINEINNDKIEHLELIWIRGLNDLSNISTFKKLKSLLIQDQIQLSSIHFDTALPGLTDCKILNCKTLGSLTGINNLNSLNQLRISKTTIDFDSFIKQELPQSLKILAFYTSKSKIDKQIKAVLQIKGFSDGLDR